MQMLDSGSSTQQHAPHDQHQYSVAHCAETPGLDQPPVERLLSEALIRSTDHFGVDDRDTDYAAETARLVRLQILQQASLAILSQANLQPQLALQLLG